MFQSTVYINIIELVIKLKFHWIVRVHSQLKPTFKFWNRVKLSLSEFIKCVIKFELVICLLGAFSIVFDTLPLKHNQVRDL